MCVCIYILEAKEYIYIFMSKCIHITKINGSIWNIPRISILILI